MKLTEYGEIKKLGGMEIKTRKWCKIYLADDKDLKDEAKKENSRRFSMVLYSPVKFHH